MADFDYNKTYGPEGGSFVVDHPGGSVTVPSGKVLEFEWKPVPVLKDPPKKQEAKVKASPVKAKATVRKTKKKGTK